MFNKALFNVPDKFLNTIVSEGCYGDSSIVEAFRTIPRAYFVDEAMRFKAYTDNALPIGFGQTISQPSLVALMLYKLELKRYDKCLEVGVGSGFVSALLGKLVDEVFGVELLPELYKTAKKRVRELLLNNVHINLSNGVDGYPSHSPYDKIVVSANASIIPNALLDQLKDNGIMLIPINGILVKVLKIEGGYTQEDIARVAFVDFVGT